MIKITVPATSANLGAGFDCLGVALGLYNTVWVERSETLLIESKDDISIPTDESNLFYHTMAEAMREHGHEPGNYHIIMENSIPMTRGLGSSSACIVAGLLAADYFMGKNISRQEMIDIACRLEGHPDNSTPALLGGFVASVYQDGKVHCVKVPTGKKLSFAAFVPDIELKTEKARAILPAQVSREDAIFNLSRAALMSISILSGDYHNLSVAVEDRLHQPYRMGLLKDGEKVMALAKKWGALGTYLSGAGPTLISLVESTQSDFFLQAEQALEQELPGYRLLRLEGDDEGAKLEEVRLK